MAWTGTEIATFKQLIKQANPDYERFFKSSLRSLVTLVAQVPPLPSATAVRNLIDQLPDKKEARYKQALTYLRKHFPGLDEVKKGGSTFKGFSGTLNEEARLNRAVAGLGRCNQLVTMCKMAMAKVVSNTFNAKSPAAFNAQEREATELFQKWLDLSRKDINVNRVRAVFNSMADALRGQDWEIVLYGTPEDPDPDNLGGGIEDAFAFVIPSENAYRIYLGSQFWVEGNARIDVPTVAHANAPESADQWQEQKKTKTAMDAAIITTLHELCHVRAISGATAITDVKPSPYNLDTCKERASKSPHLALTNAENYAQFASALWMSKHFF